MSLFESLKNQAVKAVLNSGAAQQISSLLIETLQKAEGTSVEVLSSPTQFRSRISYPTYARLPRPLQALLTPEQWHDVAFSLKDQWFLVQDGRLRLQPEFRQSLEGFVQQLLYGKKTFDRKARPKQKGEPLVIDVPSGKGDDGG